MLQPLAAPPRLLTSAVRSEYLTVYLQFSPRRPAAVTAEFTPWAGLLGGLHQARGAMVARSQGRPLLPAVVCRVRSVLSTLIMKLSFLAG